MTGLKSPLPRTDARVRGAPGRDRGGRRVRGARLAAVLAVVLLAPATRGAPAPDGRALYDRHCYFCHGYSGDARTAAAAALEPPPRDFTAGMLPRERMLEAVARACDEAVEALPVAGVAVAADALTHGLAALDGLTGADTREEVLDAVFARFCIGK